MADIVTVPEGNFTPGAQATLDFAAALINAAWEQANTKNTTFDAKIAAAEAWLDTAVVADITADVAAPAVIVEPVVEIPATQSAAEVMSTFDTKYLELVAMLSDKFVAFRSTYFPDESATYEAAESWLKDAIDNPESGLPPAVAAQLLEEDRSRILADASRAADAVMTTFAARRFPLPPGAAASAVLEIQQKAQEEIASSSRKLTVLSVEQMKFAVEKAVTNRHAAMGDAVAYIQALASGPEMASRVVGVGYDAQSKLITSAAGFYNARTGAAELVSKVQQFNVTSKLAADEKNQSVDMTLVEERIKILLTECQSLAQMATSMYNNLHASAGTSYSGSSATTE